MKAKIVFSQMVNWLTSGRVRLQPLAAYWMGEHNKISQEGEEMVKHLRTQGFSTLDIAYTTGLDSNTVIRILK